MMRYALVALAWLAVIPVHAAEMAEQRPPKNPRLQSLGNWQHAGRYGDQLAHIETTTIGRIGDTGYVWLVVIPKLSSEEATWYRTIADCKTGRVYEDWYAFMNDAGSVTFDSKGDRRWERPIRQAGIKAWRAACAGTPPAFGPNLTWAEAVKTTRRLTWDR